MERGEFKKQAADIDPLALFGASIYMVVWKILFEDFSPIDIDQLVDNQMAMVLVGQE